MGFVRFSRTAARADSETKWVSIQGNGSISVSYAAIKSIGVPDFVFLLYDADVGRIAIQAAPADHRDAYPTRLQGKRDNKHGARVVSASAFFKHIGVDSSTAAGRYDADIASDMVIVTLPSTGVPT